jgi:hypothetical protein
MNQEIIFRKNIAVGQKSSEPSGPYGRGFNYVVEISFPLAPGFNSEPCLKAIDDVLSAIDHKALGVDVDLGVEPTSFNLCKYIAEEIKQHFGQSPVSVKMIRGDGFTFKVPGPFSWTRDNIQ